MDWVDWLLLMARVVVVFFALLISVLLFVWMERKVIADFQTRKGPMRAGPRGILSPSPTASSSSSRKGSRRPTRTGPCT